MFTKRPPEHGMPTVLANLMRTREQGKIEKWQIAVLEISGGRGSGRVGTGKLVGFYLGQIKR